MALLQSFGPFLGLVILLAVVALADYLIGVSGLCEPHSKGDEPWAR